MSDRSVSGRALGVRHERDNPLAKPGLSAGPHPDCLIGWVHRPPAADAPLLDHLKALRFASGYQPDFILRKSDIWQAQQQLFDWRKVDIDLADFSRAFVRALRKWSIPAYVSCVHDDDLAVDVVHSLATDLTVKQWSLFGAIGDRVAHQRQLHKRIVWGGDAVLGVATPPARLVASSSDLSPVVWPADASHPRPSFWRLLPCN